MPLPDSAVGPAILSITQGMAAFSTFLPDLTDIRRADLNSDPEFAADVRTGETFAAAVVLGIGALTSAMIGQPYPFYISALVSALLFALYEWALRGRPFSVRQA